MLLDIYQVNAFTCESFKGNPAAVCITQDELPVSLMLLIAKEMAVSETSFLSLAEKRLRWFTPQVEVALCGHGTVATVKVMDELGLLDTNGQTSFQTLSGELTARMHADRILIDFPVFPPRKKREESSKLNALGIDSDDVEYWGEFETKDFLVLKEETRLHSLTPNYRLLEYCAGRGMVVSTLSFREDVDIVCRYFAPWVGVNEDPVTGSAYCALAPYWGNRLGKSSLVGYQDSERGGYVSMLVTPHGVEISGQAIIVIRGTLTV
jgi:PhzF family phenazine biosynthesis protein